MRAESKWNNSETSAFLKANFLVSLHSSYCKLNLKFLEAEEAQAKIEELKDEEYNERRTAVLNQNDAEMNEMLQQRDAHMAEFTANWDAHEKQLLESSEHDLQLLEEN